MRASHEAALAGEAANSARIKPARIFFIMNIFYFGR
jgi:hypothetical protein